MIRYGLEVSWAYFDRTSEFVWLDCSEISKLIVFVKIIFEIYFAVQLTFQGSRLLYHGGTAAQGDFVHLGLNILKLSDFPAGIGLDGCNNIGRCSVRTHS